MVNRSGKRQREQKEEVPKRQQPFCEDVVPTMKVRELLLWRISQETPDSPGDLPTSWNQEMSLSDRAGVSFSAPLILSYKPHLALSKLSSMASRTVPTSRVLY